jgi:bifunctional NMN adenylyltransferase/nudix hydrolase
MIKNSKTAVYVGRFNPIHLGHVNVIRQMLDKHRASNTLVIIGSSNTPQSLRHFFSYEERKFFIQKLFPDVRLVGLPDYNNDAAWISALEDILKLAGMDIKDTVFFGGSKEDTRFFEEAVYKVHIVNRFEGAQARISATEVRDALMLSKPLDGLVHEDIHSDLREIFAKNWEKFKKI